MGGLAAYLGPFTLPVAQCRMVSPAGGAGGALGVCTCRPLGLHGRGRRLGASRLPFWRMDLDVPSAGGIVPARRPAGPRLHGGQPAEPPRPVLLPAGTQGQEGRGGAVRREEGGGPR
jgi:hypothetical protein